LEWYRVEADYTDVMTDCENLMLFILNELGLNDDGKNQLHFAGKVFDLSLGWERISVAQAFEKYAQMSADDMLDETKMIEVAKKKGYNFDSNPTWEEAYNQVLLNEIEPRLGVDQPTILYDYPSSQAALSKKKQDDPRFAERFEFFLGGLELGNAFSELTDAYEQKMRMMDDLEQRKKLGKVEYQLDQDFINALESGMPETGGIAVGVDRLVMLFANADSIKETLFFPIDDIFEL
jgi:elongation factor P--(R)-beta-lysine ligase